jgi:signal transduction histidine kinase
MTMYRIVQEALTNVLKHGGYMVTPTIPLDSQIRRLRVASAEQLTPEHEGRSRPARSR